MSPAHYPVQVSDELDRTLVSSSQAVSMSLPSPEPHPPADGPSRPPPSTARAAPDSHAHHRDPARSDFLLRRILDQARSAPPRRRTIAWQPPPAARHPAAVERLVAYVLEGRDDRLEAFIGELMDSGDTADDLFLDLLPRVARRLGEMWEEDSCSFVDVTLGVGRMQRLVRRLQPTFLRDRRVETDGRSIYLAATPGEDHTFGLMITAEVVARAGWCVSMGKPLGTVGPEILGRAWHNAAGFSLARESGIHSLRGEISRVRSVSLNPSLVVLVGGEAVRCGADLLREAGADAVVRDADEAPGLLDRLTAGT